MKRLPVFASSTYHRRLGGCRVCRLVAATVFLAIVAIEALIFLPSYQNERARRVDALAGEARAFAEGARRGLGLAASVSALPDGITGIALHDPQGRPVTVLGRTAGAAGGAIAAPPRALPDGWMVRAWLDADVIAAGMQGFVLRIAGLILLIAVFATAAAMLVMGHTVLLPLLQIERALGIAARSPNRTRFEPLELPRHGELRSMAATANLLFAELAHFNRAEQLRNSLTDPLTGLYNRGGLLAMLDSQDRLAWTLFLVDVDGFARLNARHGHEGGDRILRTLAERLAALSGEGDVLARTLADEFVLARRAPMSPVEASAVASRLVADLSLPVAADGPAVAPSVSCGVAVAGQAAADEARLQALRLVVRRAKEDGGGRVRFLDADLDALAKRRRRLERSLRGAFDRGEIHVAYQAKVCLATGALCGAEALARWRLRGAEDIPPAEFVPICEDIGLIEDLTRQVLQRVLADVAAWRADGLAPPRIAVNVSARQFQDPALVTFIDTSLKSAGTPGEALEIEITESAFIGNIDHAAAQLQRLRAIGVTAAIDDFGTGYSALSYLRHLPVATLKIDRGFVQGIEADEGARWIADTIVALGNRLGVVTVAEGVETTRQAEILAAAGCGQAQGFLFSRPVAAAAFRRQLAAAAAGGAAGLFTAA
ncbi:MAG: EAL domain-containing protein [Sneathiellaceae bacterium]